MPIITYLIIQIIVCFVIDVSGAVDHLVKPIVKRTLRIPPQKDIAIPLVGCSLCVGWWVNLIVWAVSDLSLGGILCVTLLSCYSRQITGVLYTVGDFLDWIISGVQSFIKTN